MFGVPLVARAEEPAADAKQLEQNAAAKQARETRDLVGWQVHISRSLLDDEPEPTARALELLEAQLRQIVEVVPAAAVVELRKVPLYVSPPYDDQSQRAEFHPNRFWLLTHGRDMAMAKAVEFTNTRIFEEETVRMPVFALHELAHAYHFRTLEDGFKNRRVQEAYERAKASGSYEKVKRWNGRGKDTTVESSYALTNAMEYFAESTEAYFGRNDFFPFTREELLAHDPVMHDLLGELWGVEQSAE